MFTSRCVVLVTLLVVMVTEGVWGTHEQVGGVEMEESAGLEEEEVGVAVSQVMEHQVGGCHLVAVTTHHTPFFSRILRRVSAVVQGSVVVDTQVLYFHHQPPHLHHLWESATSTCWALLIHLAADNNDQAFRFLESVRLWLRPKTPLLVVGRRWGMEDVIHHHSLHNTLHILYLALHAPHTPLHNTKLVQGTSRETDQAWGGVVSVYRRCLFCNNGEMGAQQLHQDHQTPQDLDLFHGRLDNFLGHKFKIVTLNYFPFIAYEMGEEEDPTSPVTLRDSLDTRILRTLATHLNFTYEVREPKDGKWGVPMADGNWTGIVGTLQHQEADFSLDLTLTEARVKVISHSRIYTHDPLVIVSPKPKPLPRHLALMRPFTGKLWLMIFVSSLTFGIVLWAFQRAWSCVSGGRGLEFSSTLFYSWGVLLEDPPTPTPLDITGQVLVGWWLVFSLVMTSAYRSSLIAHLTVQGKHLPINTFQDLLHQDDWTWGGRVLRGTTFLYFNQSNDPAVLHIYRNMKVKERVYLQGYKLEEALDRVLGGRFSYITYRTQVKVNIPALYTDTYGNTPLHISTTEYPIFGGNSWGFRQGAPFIDPIRRLKQRLIETGFIDHWIKDVMKVEAKVIRAERGKADEVVYAEAEERQVVLELDHLQGAFYLLALGYTLALLTLLGEKLAHLPT